MNRLKYTLKEKCNEKKHYRNEEGPHEFTI